LWLQDPLGRYNAGRWFLCDTYDERSSAEFVAYLCETRGLRSEIVAVPILNPHFRR
jgi:hypothetical protein